MLEKSFGVIPVIDVDTGTKKWDNGNMHEKVGVSHDAKWICFGDANHRISEMTHAGLTVSAFSRKSTSIDTKRL